MFMLCVYLLNALVRVLGIESVLIPQSYRSSSAASDQLEDRNHILDVNRVLWKRDSNEYIRPFMFSAVFASRL